MNRLQRAASRVVLALCVALLALTGVDCKSPGSGGGPPDSGATSTAPGGNCGLGPDEDPQDPTCEACAASAFGVTTKSDPPKDSFPKPDVTCDAMNSPKRMDLRLTHARSYLVVKQSLGWLRDKERIVEHHYAQLTNRANAAYLTEDDVVTAIDGIKFVLDEVEKYRAWFNQIGDAYVDQLFEAREMDLAWWLKWDDPSKPSFRDHDAAMDEIPPYLESMVADANFAKVMEKDFLRGQLPRVRSQLGGSSGWKRFVFDYQKTFDSLAYTPEEIAAIVAQVKGDPWRLNDAQASELKTLLGKSLTARQAYHGVQAYVGLVNRELDLATSALRNKLLTLADLRRQGELPSYGELKPASSYLRLEEVVQRYFESSLVHDELVLFQTTADALWEDAEKVTAKDDPGLGEDGLSVVKSQDVAMAMLDSLNTSFQQLLEQQVIFDCGKALGKSEVIPCYVNAEVLYALGARDVERYEAAVRNYLATLTKAYLEKAERIVSYDEYRTWRDAFRKTAIAKARDVIEHFWAKQGCLTHQMVAKDLAFAREHNRFGTGITDLWNNPWNLDFYTVEGQLKKELRDLLEGRIDMVVKPITNATSITQIRDRSSDETLFGILQGLSNDLKGDAQRYVRDYVGNVSFYSNVSKTVISVTVVTVATFAVPLTGGTSMVVAVLVVGTTSGVTEYVVSTLDNPDTTFKESFTRGFIAGAIPVPIARATSGLIANIARNRAMSSMATGGLRLLENGAVGVASGGVLYVAEQKLQGKAIELGGLATAMAYGGGTGMAVFAGHTLFRLGRSANLRRNPPTEASFKPVADQLGVDVSQYRNPDGSVRWRAVYWDAAVQAKLGSQVARTAFSKSLTKAQRVDLGQFIDAYGPLFVPPVVPVTDATTAVYARAEGVRYAARNSGGEIRGAWTKGHEAADKLARFRMHPEAIYRTSTNQHYRGDAVSKMSGAAGAEIDRKFAVFDARRQEALRIAIEQKDVGKAFKYLTDPCFLKDIDSSLNPTLIVPPGTKMNFTLVVDRPFTKNMSAQEVLEAWKSIYRNNKSYFDNQPGGGASVDSAGKRHGVIRFPHVDNLRVKGTKTVYNVNDPLVADYMTDQLFALAEEIQHSIQSQAIDGYAIKYKPFRQYLDYVLNSAPVAERDAFLHAFGNDGLGGLVEIDIFLDRIAMPKHYECFSFALQTFHRERWKAFTYFDQLARSEPKWKDVFARDWAEFCPKDKIVPNPSFP